MTSFVKTPGDEKPLETKDVKVEEVLEPVLVSRFKASPQMWDEAMNLADMLQFCRPHLTRTESRFINKYIRPMGIKHVVLQSEFPVA